MTTKGDELREAILEEGNLSSLCARHLLSAPHTEDAGQGTLTLEGIHRLRWPGVAYHPLKHRAAAQAALSRLRTFLGRLGFSLALVPGKATYRLATSAGPWYRVLSRKRNRHAKTKTAPFPQVPGPEDRYDADEPGTPDRSMRAMETLTPTERTIVSLLKERTRLETRELRLCLGGVTRQTLHPMLKRLEELGLVERVPNGPRTWYRLSRSFFGI